MAIDTHWRGVFAGLAVLTLLASALLFRVVPDRPATAQTGGIPTVAVAIVGMVIFMMLQLVVALGYTGAVLPLWVGFGFFGTAGNLSYAILSQAFPAGLAGRVNTALNLLVFVGAFVMQWGLGAVIGRWPGAAGGYTAGGYGTAFGLVLALQVLALGWFWYAGVGRATGRAPVHEG